MTNHIPNSEQSQKTNGALPLLARTFWMLVGNAILIISAAYILTNKVDITHTVNFIFWGDVAALIIVRYLDIKFLNGQTAAGVPASIRHWVKYSTIILIVSIVIWLLMHVLSRWI